MVPTPEAAFLGHNSTVVHMCSMLGQHAQDLYEFMSDKMPGCGGGEGHKIPSLTEKLLVKDRKGAIDLLKGVALEDLTHLVDGPKPKIYRQH